MVDEMDLIEERPSVIVYKAILITDDFSLFHGSCRGKTKRINERILASYVLDNDTFLLNIRSRKLKSYIKNFISSRLFNLYIHLFGVIDKQLNINIKETDNPDRDLLKNSLLILIQRDGDKLIVKECDDRLSRLDL
jgi:hypothetical protein